MEDFFETYTDKMPKVDQKTVWHLSSNMSKTDVYNMYVQDCTDTHTDKISYQYFCQVWAKEFEHVKIPETNRFKQCDM